MRLDKLLEILTRTPLLMRPERVDSLVTLFHQHAHLNKEEFKAAREGVDWCGDPVELEQMTIEDGLAMIPVKGPLGIGLDAFEKGAGATDYADIMDDVRKANENPKVENILLVMDTPGGMWGGLLECAAAIEASAAPVYCFVPAGGMVASAGMFLAAVCAGRFLSPSASAGSIGVYCAIVDTSKIAEDRGLKIKVFSSGTYKGMGYPGTSLTEAQEELLQTEVMDMAQVFYDHMRANLGDIADESMQGQMFRAPEAVKLGFADDVVQDLDALKEFLG